MLLGVFFNEFIDVVFDVVLYLFFVLVLLGSFFWFGLVIVLVGLLEFVGVLGSIVGVGCCYDGFMGKSDWVFVFGVLGLVFVLELFMFGWMVLLMFLLVFFIVFIIVCCVCLVLVECVVLFLLFIIKGSL